MKKYTFVLLCILFSLIFFCIGKYSNYRCLFSSENVSTSIENLSMPSLVLKKGMSMKELNHVIKYNKLYEQIPPIPSLGGPYDMSRIIPPRFFKDKRVQYSSIRLKNIITKDCYEIFIAGNIENNPDKNEIFGIYRIIDNKKSPDGLMDLYDNYYEFDFSK